jgi:asparagine synthase (glutamine-hydrolysing)
VGLFLSGGIDSSAVAVELVARGHKLLALSVAFDEDHTDLPYATCVAKYLGLPHEVIEVSGNVANDLERILWHYDEPFADTSSIPSFYIAQAARNSCKVILNGDGGDEAFGGYRHYEYIGLKQGLKRLACAAGLRDGSPLDHWQVYFQSKAIFRRGERIALLNKKGIETEEVFDHFIDNQPFLTSARTNNALQRALWADRSVQLPDCYLYKMDIALSAFGMEGRSPFLDHRLLEWAQKLPTSDLVVKREKKILLRAAFRGQLPNEVLNRPKWGFGAPAMRWLRGSLAHLVKEHIPMPLLASAPQQHVLEAIQRSDGDRHVMRIWSLLIFSLWCQKWRADW